MRGRDTSIWRPVTLIVLMMVVAVVLRGYLPDVDRSPPPAREPATDNPASLFVVGALIGISFVIIAIAVVTQLRNQSASAIAAAGRSVWYRGGGTGRPRWRTVLILAGLLVAYLTVVMVLARLFHRLDVEQSRDEREPGISRPADDTAPGDDPVPPSDLPPAQDDGTVLAFLYAAMVGLFLLVAAGMLITARRRRGAETAIPFTAADREAAPATGPESLARAAEVGLAEMGDLSREPREAIIACYAAMERELARVPGAAPRDCDTASEVLARAVEHHAVQADNAARLVDLFAEARFSPHVMTEDHRRAAVEALQLVLDELRSLA